MTGQQYMVVRNPWDQHGSRELYPVNEGMTLADIALDDCPCVILADGDAILRADWGALVTDYSTVVAVALPEGDGSNPLQVVMMLAVIALSVYTGGVAAAAFGGYATAGGAMAGAAASAAVMMVGSMVVNTLIPPPSLDSSQQASAMAAPSPTYSLGAQGNSARLGAAIPVQYGRVRSFPDFAAMPYVEFAGNEQYLYQLFCLGCGQYSIEKIEIDDALISSFAEITYEVIQPHGRCTLFPTNVVTASQVSGQTLTNGEFIGPFPASDPEMYCNTIGVDVVMPKGMFYANDEGGLDPVHISVRFEYAPIDMYGNPTAGFSTLGTESWTLATNTPQRFSRRYSVPPGRYQVRATRVGAENTEARYGHQVVWASLRAYLPDTTDFGDVTLIAMRMLASNNLSQQSSRKVSVTSTRMLPIWNGSTWSANTATRSIAWAMADALRNTEYGAGVADVRLPLNDLRTLENMVWSVRGDHFDARFDNYVSTFEAISQIANAGRSKFFTQGGFCRVARDGDAAVPVAMFTERNIKKGSFSIDYLLPTEDTADIIELTYFDDQVWAQRTVKSDYGGAVGTRVGKKNLFGVTSRAHAYREAMYLAATNRLRRRVIKFSTEMDGFIPSPLDLIAIQHSMPGWSQQCEAVKWESQYRRLTVNESLTWGTGQHFVGLRKVDGSVSGPHQVTRGLADNLILFSSDLDYFPVTSEVGDFGANLLSYANDLTNGVWIKSGVTVAQNQDETWLLTDDSAAASESIHRTITRTNPDERLVYSVRIKKDAVGKTTRFPGVSVAEYNGTVASNHRWIFIDTATGEHFDNAADGYTTSATYIEFEWTQPLSEDAAPQFSGDVFVVRDHGAYWQVSITVTPLDAGTTSTIFAFYPAAGSSDYVGTTSPTATGSVTVTAFRVAQESSGVERTHLIFGEAPSTIQYAKVISVRPTGLHDVSIEAVNEDAGVHVADAGVVTPPVVTSSLVRNYGTPTISDLQVVVGGTIAGPEVSLAWRPAAGAEYYVVDQSSDGNIWSRLLTTITASARSLVSPGLVYLRVAGVRGADVGPYLEWFGDLVNFMPPPAPPTGLALEQPFVGRSCKIAWVAAARSESHRVEVIAEGNIKRTIDVSGTRYQYSEEDATADGGPWRSLTFRVYGIGNGVSAAYAELTVANPQVAPLTGVGFIAGYKQIIATYNLPADTDFAGVVVAMSLTDGFTPSAGNYAYDGPDKLFVMQSDPQGIPFTDGQVWYLRMAGYDKFGQDALNWSSQHTITIIDADLTPEEILERLNSSFVQGNVIIGGQGYIMAYDGISSIPNRDFVLMDAGKLTYRRYRDGAYQEYMGLKRAVSGSAVSGETVVIDGYWDDRPKIVVSPNFIKSYEASVSGQSQAWSVRADSIQETSPGSQRWQFEAVAELTYYLSSGTTVINQQLSGSANDQYSAEYNLVANIATLTVNVGALSVRGTATGTYVYAYRNVTAIAQLWNGAAWIDSGSIVLAMGATTTSTKSNYITCSGVSGKTKMRVRYVAADAGGTFSLGANQYYQQGPYYITGPTTTLNTNGYYNQVHLYGACHLNTFNVPAYSYVSYMSVTYDASGHALGFTDAVYFPNGQSFQGPEGTGSQNGAVYWTGSNYGVTSIPLHIFGQSYWDRPDIPGVELTISNATATIYIQTAYLNSATPSNVNHLTSLTWTTAGSSAIATGSLNWMATGE